MFLSLFCFLIEELLLSFHSNDYFSDSGGDSKTLTIALVVGIVGGVIVIAVVILIVFMWNRKKRRKYAAQYS